MKLFSRQAFPILDVVVATASAFRVPVEIDIIYHYYMGVSYVEGIVRGSEIVQEAIRTLVVGAVLDTFVVVIANDVEERHRAAGSMDAGIDLPYRGRYSQVVGKLVAKGYADHRSAAGPEFIYRLLYVGDGAVGEKLKMVVVLDMDIGNRNQGETCHGGRTRCQREVRFHFGVSCEVHELIESGTPVGAQRNFVSRRNCYGNIAGCGIRFHAVRTFRIGGAAGIAIGNRYSGNTLPGNGIEDMAAGRYYRVLIRILGEHGPYAESIFATLRKEVDQGIPYI